MGELLHTTKATARARAPQRCGVPQHTSQTSVLVPLTLYGNSAGPSTACAPAPCDAPLRSTPARHAGNKLWAAGRADYHYGPASSKAGLPN